MDWIKAVEDAIGYIEENITEELTIARIASRDPGEVRGQPGAAVSGVSGIWPVKRD